MDSEKLSQFLKKLENTNQHPAPTFDIQTLMNLEKEKLGYKKTDLVFISAGNFSNFYWCPMQTFFIIQENELDKYSGYLQDKIEYSLLLKQIHTFPKTNEELLKIGENLKLNNIMTLLKRKEFENSTTQTQIEKAKQKLLKKLPPKEQGHHYETIYSKKLPKIHWIIKHNSFIFTCEPDGIGENFIYEFKSTKNHYFAKHSAKKARLQADIYALCFEKENKLIEQYIISEDKIETIKEKLNLNEVNKIIAQLKKIISGKLPKPPKEKFKCNICKYNKLCKIKII